MKIVVLDSHTLNPGDLSWEALQALGDTHIYDRTPNDRILERCPEDTNVIVSNKAFVSKEIMSSLPHLKLIAVSATGMNNVDLEAAKDLGIKVMNVPAYGTMSVAQHTFALLLELTNQVALHNQSVQNGDWSHNPDWCYFKKPLTELLGKTFGIVGLGNIGQAVARIALAMGMQVIAHHKHPERDQMDGVRFVSLEDIFTQSDVVSLHCPLTESNKAFVNWERLSQMKAAAFLINTARGALIEEKDLKRALENDVIAGAALDVLSVEPPPTDHILLGVKNCIITPHNAWLSRESRQRLMDQLVENVRSVL